METIKGKTQGLLTMKKKDARTDLLIKKTVTEITTLIDTHELSGEKDLLDIVTSTLVRLKQTGLALAFTRKHKKR